MVVGAAVCNVGGVFWCFSLLALVFGDLLASSKHIFLRTIEVKLYVLMDLRELIMKSVVLNLGFVHLLPLGGAWWRQSGLRLQVAVLLSESIQLTEFSGGC